MPSCSSSRVVMVNPHLIRNPYIFYVHFEMVYSPFFKVVSLVVQSYLLTFALLSIHTNTHICICSRTLCVTCLYPDVPSVLWNKIKFKLNLEKRGITLWPGLKINYIMHIILENCGRSLRHNISTDQPSDWPPAYLKDQPTDWLTNRPFADSNIPLIFIIRGIKINNTFPHSPPTATQNNRNTPKKSVANSPLPPKEIFFLYIYSLR